MRTLLFSLSVLLALTGCGEHAAPGAESPPEVLYAYDSALKLHPNCTDEDPDNGCMETRYLWPAFGGESSALSDSLNREISRFFFETDTTRFEPSHLDSLSGLWFTMYDSVRLRVPSYSLGWEERKYVAVLYQAPEYISLEFHSYQFTGGAHPNSEQYYRSYDKSTGRRLGTGELFLEERSDALPLLAESHFRRRHGIPPEATLADSGFYFERGEFYVPDNMALLSHGLLIHYNPYEVAPYAKGPTRIVLPRSEIDSLLRPRYRVPPILQ